MKPRVVLVPTAAELQHAAAELQVGGWDVVHGFDLPSSPVLLSDAHVACVGVVADPAEGEQVLFAVSRGVTVAVAIVLPDPIEADLLVERLHQLVGGGSSPAAGEWVGLDAETSALLGHLATGASVATAARRTAMSLRTANRRLAGARSYYSVATNREAVVAHVRRSRAG